MTLSADLTVDASAASLRRLVGIARLAGAEILRWYGGTGVVEFKGDGSPLTVADRAANDLVVRELWAWTPRVPIVSEEDAIPAFEERQRWPAFWLVDPLDGTKEFLSGNGEFTVNIALITDRAPVLGVVFAPALGLQGRLWAGAAGHGATLEDEAGRRPIACRAAPVGGLDVLASRSHGDVAALDAFLARYLAGRRVASLHNAGSSLKLCLLAAGQADLYPRLGRTMEWDIAAGHAVLAAAGGSVCRVDDGTPLRYGKPGFENPHFVAAGRPGPDLAGSAA